MTPKLASCHECGQPTDDPSGICIDCQEEIANGELELEEEPEDDEPPTAA